MAWPAVYGAELLSEGVPESLSLQGRLGQFKGFAGLESRVWSVDGTRHVLRGDVPGFPRHSGDT